MKLADIPEYSDAERKLVSQALFERYGRLVPIQLADVELQLDPAAEALTVCPALYWSQGKAEFVVCKLGSSRFRAQFFYSPLEQYGTGRAEYDNLGDCVVTLLQVQADDERRRAAGAAAAPGQAAGDDDYTGPIVI